MSNASKTPAKGDTLRIRTRNGMIHTAEVIAVGNIMDGWRMITVAYGPPFSQEKAYFPHCEFRRGRF